MSASGLLQAGEGMPECDILIVGGGSAGSVLAARLSEDAGRRVTLVEAGRDLPPGGVPADITDVFPRAYANPAYFWPELQAAARAGSGRRPYSQARLMGGGSSVMGMWALRGLPSDYDGWAADGAPGWAWNDVLPYFRKLETDRDIDSPEHGRDGPVSIGRVPPERWPGFVRALAAAGGRHQLRLLPDLNSTDVDGVFAIPASVTDAGRVSSASAYLTPAVRRRPNLRILAQAEVTKILFEGRRAVGALVRRADGAMETIRARETIVSAGAIHSPALLMKSGVGPAAHLAECGVAIVADSPALGSNLQNHLFVHLGAVVRPHARHDPGMRRYVLACARISSRQADAPEGDIFVAFISRASGHATGNRLGMLAAALYAPFSRGTVRLDRAQPGRPADGRPQPARRPAGREPNDRGRPLRPRASAGPRGGRRNNGAIHHAAQPTDPPLEPARAEVAPLERSDRGDRRARRACPTRGAQACACAGKAPLRHSWRRGVR